MYTKDKSHRVTLRLNDEQMAFILKDSETLGVSPSEYIRMVINSSMAVYNQAIKSLEKPFNEVMKAMEDNRRENDITTRND